MFTPVQNHPSFYQDGAISHVKTKRRWAEGCKQPYRDWSVANLALPTGQLPCRC